VGNNPLKYVDPTGHVKTTSKQKNAEEGAVGGVESIPEKFRVDRDALSYSNQEINQIQTDIFQSSVFEKLVAYNKVILCLQYKILFWCKHFLSMRLPLKNFHSMPQV
jgi:hypothetical protein